MNTYPEVMFVSKCTYMGIQVIWRALPTLQALIQCILLADFNHSNDEFPSWS